MSATGKMPVPQEHLVLVEQAGKPVLENGSTYDYKLNCEASQTQFLIPVAAIPRINCR